MKRPQVIIIVSILIVIAIVDIVQSKQIELSSPIFYVCVLLGMLLTALYRNIMRLRLDNKKKKSENNI